MSVARRESTLGDGHSAELRVGRDVFELTGTGNEVSVAAGSARSPDAVITIEPDVFYALATRRITPRVARGRVEVAGDSGVAGQVLDGLSGAAGG